MTSTRLLEILSRTLAQWLVLGAIAVVCVPAARGESMLLGWVPFWLVVAPAFSLLVLHRRAVFARIGFRFGEAEQPRRTRFTGMQASKASRASRSGRSRRIRSMPSRLAVPR